MKLPTPLPFWRAFAQLQASVFIRFAMAPSAGHCFQASQRQPSHDLRSRRCYPSPSLRSGPSQAGPILISGRVDADRLRGVKNCFETCDITVESEPITTNLRGSTKCRSRLSSSPFSPCPSPAACRIPLRAASLVQLQVRLSPTRWMKICSPVPRSAALRALPPAALNSACRPATRATDLTAFGRTQPISRTIRANRPGGPLFFASKGNTHV
jgi:hypothetical protein